MPWILVTRAAKGRELTWEEMDGNLIYLRDLVVAAAPSAAAAAASAAAAAGSQAAAAVSAATASAQAVIATTQAGISTTQAGIATTQAGISTTQAGLAAGSQAAAAISEANADISEANALAYSGSAYSSMLTAIAQAGLAASSAASAASVAQQDLSGVTAAKLHSSPNAVTAMCLYDVSKDSDGGAWVERCTATSWFQEALNGVYLPGGFASEMDARDYLGSYQAASIVTGDSSTFTGGVGSWVAVANGTPTAVSGRLRLTQTGVLGTTMQCSLAMTTVVGQRYQIALEIVTPQSAAQNLWWGVGTTQGGSQLAASVSMGNAANPRRLISFVATGTTSYLWIGGTTSWAQNSFAEVDNVTVKPVSFADPAGVWYQSSADGKFYRLWKNQASNSGFQGGTSGTWGSGAVAPTNWSAASNTGAVTFSASSRYPGEYQVQYVATAQRPYLQSGNLSVAAGVTLSHSFYVEAVASGTPLMSDVCVLNYAIAGASHVYRKNGVVQANGSVSIAPGDLVEVVLTTTTAGGSVSVRHGLGANGNATGDVTLSPIQIELLNPNGLATTYESKAAGVGSQSEVFRGNKAKFPRLAAIVAEATSLTIYDLTEPGRPMWMRFPGGYLAFSPLGSVAILNGELVMGSNTTFGALRRVNFIAERCMSHRAIGSANSSEGYYLGNIAQRATANTFSNKSGGNLVAAIANENVNAVSMCVMPDAPVDPVTGLQVPTIACATAGGISIIQNDGTVRNSAATGSWVNVSISPQLLSAATTTTSHYVAVKPGTLGASFALTTVSGGAAPGFTLGTGAVATQQPHRSLAVARQGVRLGLMRLNETSPAASLAASIEATYNTGWWCGDIRRCWLADTDAGAVPGGNIITGDSSDFAGGTVGAWAVGQQCTLSGASNQLVITATGTSPYATLSMAVTPGVTYQLQFDYVGRTGTYGTLLRVASTATLGSSDLTGNQVPAVGTRAYTFRATTSLAFIQILATAAIGETATFDNFRLEPVVADRTYKAKPATIYGTLTRTAVAAGAQLVAYSGFSASNYIQEPYSADLDFGTGAWTCSAWVTIPTTLPASSFPEIGGEIWDDASATFAGGSSRVSPNVYRIYTPDATISYVQMTSALTLGRVYKVGLTVDSITVLGAGIRVRDNGAIYTTLGAKQGFVEATVTTTMFVKRDGAATDIQISGLSVKEVGPAILAERSAASGASIKFGMDAVGRIVVIANDGTTTRTVTTTAAYNTGTRMKVRASYTTDGTLSISVNGRAVASTYGTPLLTMNNASAVTTTGQSRTLDAPWPGDFCLVKWGASVPTAEQMLWMYEQEKQMFQSGAQVTLPDAGSLVDVAYDDLYDRITVVSAANESNWTGLVRTSTAAVPDGAYTKAARGSGVKLLARSTTNIGVDVTIPAQNLKEELLRADDAARRARLPMTFDYVGGFTANVTNGATSLASVTGLSVPAGVNLRGVTVTGTGIPASTVITDIVGTTVYISKPATATNTGVSISMLEFPLPTGYEAETVATAGALKQEGSTKDWTRSYDGFVEKIVYGAAPGATAWVQARARRMS